MRYWVPADGATTSVKRSTLCSSLTSRYAPSTQKVGGAVGVLPAHRPPRMSEFVFWTMQFHSFHSAEEMRALFG
ncbi:hypothetical protein Y032_0466g1963 [Ancylostoma ceylanicum]|uniref:Uncharacterized protein n=1 Tax=Ancylostoma ceylanicum TaxID=53326 RepID=A0A016WWR3_9BILA|nr:hypothetical protein Y032_0466g1963 [Ancylostoma ceylanicum]